MSRTRKQGVPGQLGLFDLVSTIDRFLALPGQIKAALTEDLTRSPFRRDQVAGRMTTLLGTTITVAQLDAWTAPTKVLHRFPLEYLPAFVEATGETRALRVAALACGCRVWRPEDVKRELAQVEEERRRLAGRARTLSVLVEAEGTEVSG